MVHYKFIIGGSVGGGGSSDTTAANQVSMINSLSDISKVVYNNGKVVSTNPNGNLVMGYDGSSIRALNVTQNGSLQVAIYLEV